MCYWKQNNSFQCLTHIDSHCSTSVAAWKCPASRIQDYPQHQRHEQQSLFYYYIASMLIKEEREGERKKKKKSAWYEWRDQSTLFFFNQKQVRIYSNKEWISFSFFFFITIKSNLLVGLCRTSHCRAGSTRTSKSIADQTVGTSHGVGTIGKSAVGCGAKRGLTTSRLSGFLDG